MIRLERQPWRSCRTRTLARLAAALGQPPAALTSSQPPPAMPPAETLAGSAVPRRVLGRYLRGLRNQARLTTKVAAGLLEWSEPKLWRIETGQTVLRSLDVEAMCAVYGAPA